MTTTIDWPMVLPNPNNLREHWAVRAKRVKAQRLATGLMLRCAGVADKLRPLKAGEVLAVRLTRISTRMLDDDNLQAAFKAVRDEVAAYFHVDDADPRIRFEYAQLAGKPSTVRIAFDIDARRNVRAVAERNGRAAHARLDAEVARLEAER